MATYVNDLRLKEIATGDESGTWGTSTNTNLELIGEAMGLGAETIPNASTHTITMADGTSDEFRSLFLRLTGGGTACTVTLAPNTLSHTWIMRNETSAALTLTQGSGANVTIAAGQTKIVATDGGGSGAIVYEMDDLELAGTVTADGLTVDTDTLHVDSTNDRVGIGTTSPNDLLHIKSTSADAEITLESTFSGGDARLRMIANSSGLSSIQFQDEGDTNIGFVNYDHSDNSMHFRTNDAEAMRIDSSGQVGIGTTSPSSELHVDGTITYDGRLRPASTASDGSAAAPAIVVGFDYDTGFFRPATNTIGFATSGTERMRIDSSGNVNVYGDDNRPLSITSFDTVSAGAGWDLDATSSNGVVTVSTGGSERLRIDSSGQVGIGTSSPSELLHVQGAGSTARVFIESTNTADGQIEFQNSTTTNGLFMGLSGSTSGDASIYHGDAKNIVFSTSATERLRITSAGQVGIGVTPFSAGGNGSNLMIGDPASDTGAGLTIGATTTGDIQFGDATTGTGRYAGLLRYYHTDDVMAFWTSSSERLRIDSSGNLLVGTTTSPVSGIPKAVRYGAGVQAGSASGFASLTSGTAGDILNMSSVTNGNSGAGMYLVSIVRNNGSYATHFVGIFGVNSSSVVLYETLRSQSITVTVSGTTIRANPGTTATYHANAIPLTIDN